MNTKILSPSLYKDTLDDFGNVKETLASVHHLPALIIICLF